jgi:hypothetical protein
VSPQREGYTQLFIDYDEGIHGILVWIFGGIVWRYMVGMMEDADGVLVG